jgi:carboxypeptidase T
MGLQNKETKLLKGLVRKWAFCLVVIQFAISGIKAQEAYHRVKIDLRDKNMLLLSKLGIAMDHGIFHKGRSFETDLSDSEIRMVKAAGFSTAVEIPNVDQYYSNADRAGEYDKMNLRQNNCALESFDLIKDPINYFEGSMGGYYTLEEMVFILEWMQNKFPHIVSKVGKIGNYKTTNGNPIYFIKISDKPNEDEAEPQVLYTALHHAREPASLTQMIYYMWYVLENYDTNPEIRGLVNNTEMYFIPCVNPDGYRINEIDKPKGGGLWRKNGKRVNDALTGVDLNRNYGYKWGVNNEGSSANPSNETYRGTAPFSEVETTAMREFLLTKKIKIALNFHSYGNYLIHPWGYTSTEAEDIDLYRAMGDVMNKDKHLVFGTGTQTVGYTTNGDSDDYGYGERAEKDKIFSFTPEVGTSFWPAKSDIIHINRSVVNTNLALPRLVNGYLDHTLIHQDQYSLNDTLGVLMSKASFKDEPVTASIYIDPIYANAQMRQSLSIKLMHSDTLFLPYNLNEKKLRLGKNDIKIYVHKAYTDYTTLDSFYIPVYYGKKVELFSDKGENMSQWTTSKSWASTKLEYYSGGSSLTDSPNTTYARKSRNVIKLAKGINLKNYRSPVFTFMTKWNIEKEFDYAAVYAYTPKGDTIRLCGKYTKPAFIKDLIGEPILDGVQDNWVREVMYLDDFENKDSVYIEIEVVADDFLEKDGIYIDEIKVVSYDKLDTVSVAANDIEEKLNYVWPNPSNGLVHISEPGLKNIEVINMQGQRVFMAKDYTADDLDLTSLPNGFYSLLIREGSKTFNQRLVIIH